MSCVFHFFLGRFSTVYWDSYELCVFHLFLAFFPLYSGTVMSYVIHFVWAFLHGCIGRWANVFLGVSFICSEPLLVGVLFQIAPHSISFYSLGSVC